jgi:hypothetical protein
MITLTEPISPPVLGRILARTVCRFSCQTSSPPVGAADPVNTSASPSPSRSATASERGAAEVDTECGAPKLPRPSRFSIQTFTPAAADAATMSKSPSPSRSAGTSVSTRVSADVTIRGRPKSPVPLWFSLHPIMVSPCDTTCDTTSRSPSPSTSAANPCLPPVNA